MTCNSDFVYVYNIGEVLKVKKYIIEFIGTFFLVLVIALTGNPLAIGVGLAALVYMGGYISGAQYNPAVTLGLLLSKKITSDIAISYMLVQFLASIIASAVYFFLQGTTFVAQIGVHANFLSAILVEILFTFLLVSVVLHVAATEKTKGNDYFGIAIGFTVMVAAFAGGPISGGAFNPAVGIGPIIFDINHFSSHVINFFVYLIGPFAGGILAGAIYKLK